MKHAGELDPRDVRPVFQILFHLRNRSLDVRDAFERVVQVVTGSDVHDERRVIRNVARAVSDRGDHPPEVILR